MLVPCAHRKIYLALWDSLPLCIYWPVSLLHSELKGRDNSHSTICYSKHSTVPHHMKYKLNKPMLKDREIHRITNSGWFSVKSLRFCFFDIISIWKVTLQTATEIAASSEKGLFLSIYKVVITERYAQTGKTLNRVNVKCFFLF